MAICTAVIGHAPCMLRRRQSRNIRHSCNNKISLSNNEHWKIKMKRNEAAATQNPWRENELWPTEIIKFFFNYPQLQKFPSSENQLSHNGIQFLYLHLQKLQPKPVFCQTWFYWGQDLFSLGGWRCGYSRLSTPTRFVPTKSQPKLTSSSRS